MVKIRLRRVGSKKQASFRVVVADSRAPRDGRFIEEIGFYNPRTEPETLRIDQERALHWLKVGAQPTDSAARLLKTLGTMDLFERLKQGEPLEDLLAEAEKELEEVPVAEVPEEAEEEAVAAEEESGTGEEEDIAEAVEPEPEEPTAEEESEEEAEEPEADVEESEPPEEAGDLEEESESEE
ncbi:MAG: 30S ribosomal protein S16 [Anaerolineae bacterium]|nr:30S ribosomal protein S16 [Anaerolineae bacterium]